MKKEINVTIEDLESVGYFASTYIVDALNSALILGKPLLIEGPAGSGKTWLAKALSQLMSWELIRLQSHEGIDEDKALYEWNYRKQLLSLQSETEKSEVIDDIFSEDYLIERPILRALRSEQTSLLLIDEVDRADEEMEALAEILDNSGLEIFSESDERALVNEVFKRVTKRIISERLK